MARDPGDGRAAKATRGQTNRACVRCRHELHADWRLCPACGTPVDGSTRTDAGNAPSTTGAEEGRFPAGTLVKDLDPAIERVILRCLDDDPRRRPASPLAVAMALPGGDPVAAALAAGETPAPGTSKNTGRRAR